MEPLRLTLNLIKIIWGFIESDFVTFAVPNTAFGVFANLTNNPFITAPFNFAASLSSSNASISTASHILLRLPLILAFNVGNLFVFDLANQRAPHSVAEDRINKPWRPIPQGKITTDQTRQLMLITIPAVLCLNYVLGAWRQGVFILVLSWLYNDLQGGDEAFVREILISVAYGLFNSGSLSVAVGPGEHSLSPLGLLWTAIVSGVVLTTMQVQDLKDQAGDKIRGRKTIALFMGEQFSRTSIAFFVCFWSCVCAYFWTLSPFTFGAIAIVAAVVAVRVLYVREPKGDARTWRLWCLWHASLYTLPLIRLFDIF
ncbi:UbiA prenyltransferase family-domain-containing protein [Bombardia bombarda]|uniref:UbiA prenyltransferase family-domain-containing protein n=1 Tax=Bombardia bombarda TaxID=252184 RepID=A0AA40CDK1_9PEZI|nr:UbiA prenyltransferase family-domain-containing protein [Bombardia bombarda]